MSHSILAPSGAGIWGKPRGCRGSVAMQQGFSLPETSYYEAAEGTASHEVAAKLNSSLLAKSPLQAESFIGQTAENGILIDEAMAEGAGVFRDECQRIVEKYPDIEAFVECKIDIPRVHALCYGTPDFAAYSAAANTVFIRDYKFGHMYVDEWECWQNICYAVGLASKFKLWGVSGETAMFDLGVVQPRVYSQEASRNWVISAKSFRQYAEVLATSAEEALTSVEVTPGPHCRYCAARVNCKPSLDAGFTVFENATALGTVQLPPQALGLQLDIVRRAKKFLEGAETGLEAQIGALFEAGTTIPGYHQADKVGRRKWSKPADQIIKIGELLNIKLSKPAEAITPNQALAAHAPEAVVKSLSHVPDRGKTIKQDGTKFKRIFT